MTTNQTIDGVPRELLSEWLKALNSRTSVSVAIRKMRNELRALLDAQRIVCSNGILCQNSKCAECGGNGSYSAALLDAPEPKPRGEPVVWLDPQSGRKANTISATLKRYNESKGGAPAAASALYTVPLYAHPPAPVAVVLPDLWQPIETAPKDGTEIILRKGDRVTAGAWIEWTKSEAEFHSTGAYLGNYEYDSGASWSSWDGGFCEDDHPTHWQPLPTVTPQQ